MNQTNAAMKMDEIIQKAKTLDAIHVSQYKKMETLLWKILVYKEFQNISFSFYEGQIGMTDLDAKVTRPVLMINQSNEHNTKLFISYLNRKLKVSDQSAKIKLLNRSTGRREYLM